MLHRRSTISVWDEADPRGGHHVPYETIVKDVQNAKQLNLNAIRTSHYPPDPNLIKLADEYGLYIMDEVNVESHNARTMSIPTYEITDPKEGAEYLLQIEYKLKNDMVYADRSYVQGSGAADTVEVTVTVAAAEAPITGIKVTDAEKELRIGEEYTIEAEIVPAETTDDRALVYTFDNEEAAAVDENGVVTA